MKKKRRRRKLRLSSHEFQELVGAYNSYSSRNYIKKLGKILKERGREIKIGKYGLVMMEEDSELITVRYKNYVIMEIDNEGLFIFSIKKLFPESALNNIAINSINMLRQIMTPEQLQFMGTTLQTNYVWLKGVGLSLDQHLLITWTPKKLNLIVNNNPHFELAVVKMKR